jgi:hypothetical protein
MTIERVERETVRRFAPLVCATSIRMIQAFPFSFAESDEGVAALDHGGIRRTVGDVLGRPHPPNEFLLLINALN